MADGDHYASYAEVQYYLKNAGVGVADNTLYDANSLELALDISQVIINQYVFGDADHADVAGTGRKVICKGVQVELVFQMILLARHLQNNNLNDAGATQAFWQVSPQLTREQKMRLDIIASNEDFVAAAYDIRSGARII